MPRSILFSMAFTAAGLALVSQAAHYGAILLAVAMIGLGSAIFHPEAARIARAASGGRYGFAQSVFQVGGNAGSALGPLLFENVDFGNVSERPAWLCADIAGTMAASAPESTTSNRLAAQAVRSATFKSTWWTKPTAKTRATP